MLEWNGKFGRRTGLHFQHMRNSREDAKNVEMEVNLLVVTKLGLTQSAGVTMSKWLSISKVKRVLRTKIESIWS